MAMTTTEYTHADGTPLRVRRSSRRKQGASYTWSDDALLVTIPAAASRKQEQQLVDLAVAKVRTRQQRLPRSDDTLLQRARELDRAYLDSRACVRSIRWVDNQNTRWGSATPSEATIRLSTRLQGMPQWVVDGVIVHELAHLISTDDGHGPHFRAWLQRYPRHAEAAAFLDGVDWARHTPPIRRG